MPGRAVSEEAGQEIVSQSRSMFGSSLAISGLQIQLKNGQSTPAIIGTATIPTVSGSANGAMLSTDKTKLDGIAEGANKTTVDSSLSSSSTNPVQNKVVKAALDGKANLSHTHAGSDVTGLTAGRALISDSSGNLAASAVTATELGYLDGVTSAVQTQLNAKAPTASPTFTGTPKAPTPSSSTNNTQVATTAFVQTVVASAVTGAMLYKGTVDTFTAITNTSYKAGWYWIVSTAGTFAGQVCEVGDMVVANSNKGTSASNDDFDVIQSNIDYVTAEDVKTWFA